MPEVEVAEPHRAFRERVIRACFGFGRGRVGQRERLRRLLPVRGWSRARGALGVFVVQLAVNALWSWLFFAWRLGEAALADILLLIALVIVTIFAFARIRLAAAWLLAPYLAWITYAAALCFEVWRRNPGQL